MCKTHPTYKAIRKPKKLKATGVACPECVAMYQVRPEVRLAIFDPEHYPEDKRPIDHDYDPSKF